MSDTRYEIRDTSDGFTMVELMVAAGILGLMVAFASVIFRFSIDAHRVASANAEIMQKLRCITEQLNDDFRGLRKDAPMFIWFEQDDEDDPNRYDQIMFFADGDFSSLQFYFNYEIVDINQPTQTGSTLVRGNLARLYYGHARTGSPSVMARDQQDEMERTLARKAHIFNLSNEFPRWYDANDFVPFDPDDNYLYEHERTSLGWWQVLSDDIAIDRVIQACIYDPPEIDSGRPGTYHQLLTESVGSFSIQLAYWEEDQKYDRDYWELRWFPSDDPDDDGSDSDSHFVSLPRDNRDGMGLLFNIEPDSDISDWYDLEEIKSQILEQPGRGDYVIKSFPDAIKFTFRLYDSKGVIEGGRTFTHIIYLSD